MHSQTAGNFFHFSHIVAGAGNGQFQQGGFFVVRVYIGTNYAAFGRGPVVSAFQGGVFTKFGGFFANHSFDVFVVGVVGHFRVGQDVIGQVVGQFDEIFGFGHEVGFATQVNHGKIFAVGFNGHSAFFGFAVRAFGHIGQAFFAQEHNGLFHIVIRGQEGFFAVHQAGAGFGS